MRVGDAIQKPSRDLRFESPNDSRSGKIGVLRAGSKVSMEVGKGEIMPWTAKSLEDVACSSRIRPARPAEIIRMFLGVEKRRKGDEWSRNMGWVIRKSFEIGNGNIRTYIGGK